MSERLWAPGAVTGIGSLPGTDPVEAARLVFGELPDLPHVPELPARGPGAELVGRGAALLVDLPVEIVATGWQLAARPGRDLRRAADLLERDMDAVYEQADGYLGPLKVQLAGPWTLAANVELRTGHKVVTDAGAVRDLTESLAEGVRGYVAEVRRRVPGAQVLVQLDEPSLPAVLAGAVPTPSGWGGVPAVPAAEAEQALRTVLEAAPAGGRVVHCCADGAPIGLLRAAGADALALDIARLGQRDYDALGTAVEDGAALWLGALPATGAAPTLAAARGAISRLWSELGFPPARLARDVVPTPACGLAGASAERARQVLRVLGDVGSWLRELD